MNSARVTAQQNDITEALWRVLGTGGLQRLTLRAVAAEAGCTTGLVTSRFPSKKALLLHARQTLHERTAARMEHTRDTYADPSEALVDILADSSLRPEFNAGVWVGFIAATATDDELRRFHVAANRHYLQVVTELVARIRPDWTGDSVAENAARLVALASGFAVLAGPDPETYSPQTQRSAFTAAVSALTDD
jgi:AcrR family transcriptional regulator